MVPHDQDNGNGRRTDSNRIYQLARELSAVTTRLEGVVERLDKQSEEDQAAKENMDEVIEAIKGRLDELESKNTYRGGMLAAAIAFGGVIGWLATGSSALISLWDKARGVAQ